MRIACVDNVSAYAYRTSVFGGALDFVGPLEALRLASGGQVDAALLPSPALRLLPEMQPLPFGIACEGAVTTVVLCSQKPVLEILHENSPCRVPSASVTSRALLRQLCERAYGDSPLLVEDAPAPARILMGDDAADMGRPEYKWPFIIDLGHWWFQMTQLPFVFAQWAVRKEVEAAGRASLEEWLEACALLSASQEGLSSMVERAVANGLFRGSRLQAQRYYLRLRQRIGARESAGLAEFLKMEKGDAACARIA